MQKLEFFFLQEAFCGLEFAENAFAAEVWGAYDAPPDLLYGISDSILRKASWHALAEIPLVTTSLLLEREREYLFASQYNTNVQK